MTHSHRHNRGYLHGAVILAAGVAIVRVIGLVYRIPIANILGSEGMSTFTVAFSIYQFLLIVATAGLPVALSKMIASADALNRPAQVRRVYTTGRNAFVIIGTGSFLIMAVFHQQLANLMQLPDAARAILALSPALFFVGLISAYRGYCQGLSEMAPTSISQIIEAVVRLVLGVGAAWLFVRWGFSEPVTVAGAILGTTVGAGIAAAYLFVAKRRVDRHRHMPDGLDTPDSGRRVLRNLRNIAIPLTVGASLFHFIAIINNAVILGQLQGTLGLDPAVAQSLHGTYGGMVFPLFNLPSGFIIPITVALIPAISGFLAQGDVVNAKKTSESGIRVTCLLAMPAGVGLTVLAGPVMSVLYHGRYAAEGPGLMAWMGIAAFFICFFQATNCVLQAYGFQRYTMVTLPVGGLISVLLTLLLVGDPRFSIYGAAISMVACYVVISVINMVLVKRRIPDPPSFLKILVRPLLCTAVMAFAAWGSFGLISNLVFGGLTAASSRLSLTIALGSAIGIAMVVYLVLIIATRALTKEDMHMLPKGEKLAKLLRVR